MFVFNLFAVGCDEHVVVTRYDLAQDYKIVPYLVIITKVVNYKMLFLLFLFVVLLWLVIISIFFLCPIINLLIKIVAQNLLPPKVLFSQPPEYFASNPIFDPQMLRINLILKMFLSCHSDYHSLLSSTFIILLNEYSICFKSLDTYRFKLNGVIESWHW